MLLIGERKMINAQFDFNLTSITEFFDLNLSVENFINKKAPLGKIVIFYSRDISIKNAIDLGERLRKNNKVIYYVLSDEYKLLSVDDICHAFNLHEDIRLSIALDNVSLNFAKYFSSVRNIPLLYVSNDFVLDEIKDSLYLKNGDKIDVFSCEGEKFLLLTDSFENYRLELFSYIANKSFCIVENYITNICLNKPFNLNSALKVKDYLLKSKNILVKEEFSSPQNKAQFFDNILNAFNLDNENKNKFFKNGASSVCQKLLNKPFSQSKIFYLNTLILFLLKNALKKENIMEDKSYNQRAEDISSMLNIPKLQPLETIKNQFSKIKDFTLQTLEKINEVYKECESLFLEFKKDYLALGGKLIKISPKERRALLISGDFVCVNIMSVIREINLIND